VERPSGHQSKEIKMLDCDHNHEAVDVRRLPFQDGSESWVCHTHYEEEKYEGAPPWIALRSRADDWTEIAIAELAEAVLVLSRVIDADELNVLSIDPTRIPPQIHVTRGFFEDVLQLPDDISWKRVEFEDRITYHARINMYGVSVLAVYHDLYDAIEVGYKP